MDNFFKKQNNISGVKGLVYLGDRILVYRRDNNTDYFPLQLDLPGGGNDPGETPYESFKREINEEFGLKINKGNIVYARAYTSKKHKGTKVYFPVAKLPFALRDSIVLGGEGTDYFLFSPQDFLKDPFIWQVFKDRTNEYLRCESRQCVFTL